MFGHPRSDLLASVVVFLVAVPLCLGIAIASMLNLMNPAKVILGGSLTQVGEALLTPLRETVRRRRAIGGPAEKTFATLVGLEMRPLFGGGAQRVRSVGLRRRSPRSLCGLA